MTDNQSCSIKPPDLSGVEIVNLAPEQPLAGYDQAAALAKAEAQKRFEDYMLISWYDRDRDFESPPNTSKVEEYWTGDYIFENEWQSFRTKKDRSLELKTPFHECAKGRYKVAIKVVDIFGNDTMKIVEVSV
ncbi:MAG: AF1514 family protein [Desulfobulbaceae bacterium]|nr:AF1514 family protein [Desulfobulbaceae bacterium]